MMKESHGDIRNPRRASKNDQFQTSLKACLRYTMCSASNYNIEFGKTLKAVLQARQYWTEGHSTRFKSRRRERLIGYSIRRLV